MLFRLTIRIVANTAFAKTHVTGNNHVTMLYSAKARKLNPCRKVVMVYSDSVSEYGSFQDFRIVGANPNISMVDNKMIESTGCRMSS